MSISEGKLVYEGKQIGFIKDSVFLVNLNQGDWIISASGMIKDDKLTYTYNSSNPSSQAYLKEKASLSR